MAYLLNQVLIERYEIGTFHRKSGSDYMGVFCIHVLSPSCFRRTGRHRCNHQWHNLEEFVKMGQYKG